ncbi:MAG: hypothetical protein RSD68_06585, partial [Oscillospiraceae bacterium]
MAKTEIHFSFLEEKKNRFQFEKEKTSGGSDSPRTPANGQGGAFRAAPLYPPRNGERDKERR